MSRVHRCFAALALAPLLFAVAANASAAPASAVAEAPSGEAPVEADEPTRASADDPRSLLEAGVASYAAAQEEEKRDLRLEGFRRAERLFGRAQSAGARSAALEANRGNAALQSERLGAAVLAYRRALVLDPGLERARRNLQHARTLLPEWVPTPDSGGVLDTFFFWHRSVPRATRLAAASACVLLAALLAALAISRRSTGLSTTAGVVAALWAVLMTSVVFDPARAARDEGVVVANELVARASDSSNAPELLGRPLPAGTEVTLVEDRGEWLQVRLSNGRTAWVSGYGVDRVVSD